MKRDILGCFLLISEGTCYLTAYYIMLLGLSLCGVCLCIRNRSRLKDGIFLLISFVVLGTMSAIRYDVGIDYSYIYSPNYEKVLADPTGQVLAQNWWEPSFKLLLKILMMFTRNYHALFVVTSLIIGALVMLYYWLHSPNPFISVFLFVVLSQYYCSMDFLRQMIAAVITMYAFPLLKKRNTLSIAGYFAIVLLAVSFHRSALILIPFFFINLIPVNKYTLALFAAATAALYFNTDRIIGFVTQYWYPQYGLDNIHMKVAFTPQFTIAVAVVFLIFFLGSGILRKLDKRNYLYVNYTFFTMFFVLMGTRHSIIDRLSMYFELLAPVGIAIIVHKLAEQLRTEKPSQLMNRYSATLASLLVVIFGGGLAIHQYALTMDHHGVVPYKIIFNQPFYKGYVDSLKGVQTSEEPSVEPDDLPMPELKNPTPPQDPHVDAFEQSKAEIEDGELVETSLEGFLDSDSAQEQNSVVTEEQQTEVSNGGLVEVSLEDFLN